MKNQQAKHKDQMSGGIGDKKKPSDFDPKALAAGVKVEMEHTDDPAKAREIAIDHLTEDKAYYRKLKMVEKSGIDALGEYLEKSGGPFIGPKGGKWADAAHTIPWDEKKHGKKKEGLLRRVGKKLAAIGEAAERMEREGKPIWSMGKSVDAIVKSLGAADRLELYGDDPEALEKAGGHKYIKRTGTPGNYRYEYETPSGERVAVASRGAVSTKESLDPDINQWKTAHDKAWSRAQDESLGMHEQAEHFRLAQKSAAKLAALAKKTGQPTRFWVERADQAQMFVDSMRRHVEQGREKVTELLARYKKEGLTFVDVDKLVLDNDLLPMMARQQIEAGLSVLGKPTHGPISTGASKVLIPKDAQEQMAANDEGVKALTAAPDGATVSFLTGNQKGLKITKEGGQWKDPKGNVITRQGISELQGTGKLSAIERTVAKKGNTFEVDGDTYPNDSDHAKQMAESLQPPDKKYPQSIQEWNAFRDWAVKHKVSKDDMSAMLAAHERGHTNEVLKTYPKSVADVEKVAEKLGVPSGGPKGKAIKRHPGGGESLDFAQTAENAKNMSNAELNAALDDIMATLPSADAIDREQGTDRGGLYRDEASVYRNELKSREGKGGGNKAGRAKEILDEHHIGDVVTVGKTKYRKSSDPKHWEKLDKNGHSVAMESADKLAKKIAKHKAGGEFIKEREQSLSGKRERASISIEGIIEKMPPYSQTRTFPDFAAIVADQPKRAWVAGVAQTELGNWREWGLIEPAGSPERPGGPPSAWKLTPKGEEFHQFLRNKGANKSMGAIHQLGDYLEKAMPSDKADISPEKARQILHDGEVHGKALTDQQRKFFGAIGGHLPAPKTEKSMSGIDALGEYMEKAGSEGSRGGKVIGHTASGKPIYGKPDKVKAGSGKREYEGWTANDHKDAARHFAKLKDDYDNHPHASHMKDHHSHMMQAEGDTGALLAARESGKKAEKRLRQHRREEKKTEKSMSAIDALSDGEPLVKCDMPTGQPTNVNGGAENGGDLDGQGKPAGSDNAPNPDPDQDADGHPKDVPTPKGVDWSLEAEARRVLGGGTMKSMGSLDKDRAVAARRLSKSDPDVHPYKVEAVHGDVEELSKGGSHPDDPRNAIISKDVLCKSCKKAHPAMLTGCPNCGEGTIGREVLHKSNPGVILENPRGAPLLRPPSPPKDILIKG